MDNDNPANLFLRVKPAKMVILLRDKSRRWYISALAKEVDMTVSHMLHLIRKLEDLGIVSTKLAGRSRYVELTDKGDELARDFEDVFRCLEEL